MKHPTAVDRISERELVVRRTFDHPARRVFEAWTDPTLFQRWWVPRSCGAILVSCQLDVRTGGGYRLEFGTPGGTETMPFFGTYLEVVPGERLVWTNAESDDGAVTTITFTERDGRTEVTMHDRYPSKEALDEAIASGSTSGAPETFDQLDDVLA